MVPSVTDGARAVIEVDELTTTLVACTIVLSTAGEPPDSSTKLTVVPVVKPVPLIVTDVPPRIEPEEGLMFVTVGSTGDQSQLSVVMPVPQYR